MAISSFVLAGIAPSAIAALSNATNPSHAAGASCPNFFSFLIFAMSYMWTPFILRGFMPLGYDVAFSSVHGRRIYFLAGGPKPLIVSRIGSLPASLTRISQGPPWGTESGGAPGVPTGPALGGPPACAGRPV